MNLRKARSHTRAADDALHLAIRSELSQVSCDQHSRAAIIALADAAKMLGCVLVQRCEIDGRLYLAETNTPIEAEQVPA